jgi:hypothetical protein
MYIAALLSPERRLCTKAAPMRTTFSYRYQRNYDGAREHQNLH